MIDDAYTQALNALIRKNPDAHVTQTVQPLSDADFTAQKDKHISRHALGGAVGIVSTTDRQIVLVKRSGMHAGWALPGGTVERGEGFADAFEREVKEEIGVVVRGTHLAAIEKKEFVSPASERLNFLLAVFTAQMKQCTLPAPTADAKAEGLTVALFKLNDLPATMIMGLRQEAAGALPHTPCLP
jgi:ADP-ribose pyrophosphatase YjhB (NUDIX family)